MRPRDPFKRWDCLAETGKMFSEFWKDPFRAGRGLPFGSLFAYLKCELFDLAALTWTGILRFSSNHVGGGRGIQLLGRFGLP